MYSPSSPSGHMATLLFARATHTVTTCPYYDLGCVSFSMPRYTSQGSVRAERVTNTNLINVRCPCFKEYSCYVTNQQMHTYKMYFILSCITGDRLRVLSDLQYDTHLYLINRVSISCILLRKT